MIKEFVEQWELKKSDIQSYFEKRHPHNYINVVKNVIKNISRDDICRDPDYERVHLIDDGDYQGTLVFVIGAKGYQPDDYWYVKVSYGSCSGCDTLQAISCDSSDKPSEDQIREYMMLSLHIVQGLKKMGGGIV